MKVLTQELIQIARFFVWFERDEICCNTITVSQCLVLQELLSGQRMVSELASLAGISPSAMTRLLDVLNHNGWVERIQDKVDRRKVWVWLTPTGEKEAQRLQQLSEEGINRVMACISKYRHNEILEVLQLLRKAMEQVFRGSSSSENTRNGLVDSNTDTCEAFSGDHASTDGDKESS
jgi:DNA-binding MarR family transcriptional regulator